MAHEERDGRYSSTDLLSPGTIIIAKLEPYPYWPGVIGVNTSIKLSILPTRGKEKVYWVYFYNSCTADWIPRKNIMPFNTETISRFILPNIRPGTRKDLQGALDEAKYRQEEGELEEETEKLYVGDIVLAKFEGFPNWPGKITASDHTYEKSMRGKWKIDEEIHVMFLPDSQENWVPIKDIQKYSQEKAAKTKVREDNILFELNQRALEDANSRKKDFDSGIQPTWVEKKEDELIELTCIEKADILG